jgi:hypothetical protein
MRRLAKGIAAITVAIAGSSVIVLSAGTAHADSCDVTIDGSATGCWTSYGDKFTLSATTGSNSWIEWHTDYGRHDTCFQSLCNYNMREGHTIWYHVCVARGNVTYCSGSDMEDII